MKKFPLKPLPNFLGHKKRTEAFRVSVLFLCSVILKGGGFLVLHIFDDVGKRAIQSGANLV